VVKHQREAERLPVPEDCFGAGAAKAALTGGLRPHTAFKTLESGYPASRTNYGHSGRVCFLSAEICVICGYFFC